MRKSMNKWLALAIAGVLTLAPVSVFAGKNVDQISGASKVIEVGEKFELKVFANGNGIDEDDFIWSSSDESVIALCDKQNTGDDMDFKAVGAGTATLTCRIAGTDIAQTCVVAVKEKSNTEKSYQLKSLRASGIQVKDKEDFDVKVGKKEKIEAYILNGNKKDKDLLYVSLTPKIVSVDKKGKVYGKAKGTGKIEIISKKDGSVRTVLTVRVEKR